MSLAVSAQQSPFVFTHLKESDGLGDNIINCFLKDSRGTLWIGTYNGFNRYDGSNFFVYNKRKGANSMINEVVHSLCEDFNGNIWGSTDNGVFCFDPIKDKFINYTIRSVGKGQTFYKIICDKQGNIWAIGLWSLLKFNALKNTFEDEIRPTNNRDSVEYFQIRKNGAVMDPSGEGFWLATRAGIMYFEIAKRTFLHSQNQLNDSLFKKRSVSAICLSPTGKIWFSNNDQKEIISFDPHSRRILQRISIKKELPAADGATLFEDNNHRLWFSSLTYQILLIDLANNNRVIELKHGQDGDRTVATQFFWDILQDEYGTIWLGTHAGISRCNPERNIYKEYNLPKKIPELAETSIWYLEEDPIDQNFWMLTKSLLLIHYNPGNDKYEVFDFNKAKPKSDGVVPGIPNSIRFIKDLVVINTFSGSWQLKKGTQKFVPFTFLPERYKDFSCSEMAVDGDSVVYFNNGKKLLYWNYLTDKSELISYLPDPAMPTDKTIAASIVCTPSHKVIVASYNYQIAFRNGNVLQRVKFIKDDMKDDGTGLFIEEDPNGSLWILSKGTGLYQYYPANEKLQFWDAADGLPSNRMQRIKVDRKGRVWTIFYNKLSVFIPAPGRFYNFKIPISESNLSYTNHLSVRSNGNLIASIRNEVVELFPDRIEAIPAKRKPVISQLSVNGNDFAILNEELIRLQPNQNTIRIRFGTLIHKDLFSYDIEYMLEGAEKKWTISTGNTEASYNNLAPGSYKFRVRVKGKSNSWITEEAVLPITIAAPFYKTTWFITLVALLCISSLFFLYRYRIAQKEKLLMLERKAQLLEKEKVMVMYESLKQQLNPHFLFNSLTSLSGLIETDQQIAGNFLEQMSGIYRYILKNGDTETVFLKDEIEFVQLYINLQQTRFKKGLQVNINVPDEYRHYKIAPVTLQNLIENAIKHNIIDTTSPLVIDIFIEDDYLVVKNNLQKKNVVETSNKKGLAQFTSLYRYLSNLPVLIEETKTSFEIRIPLI